MGLLSPAELDALEAEIADGIAAEPFREGSAIVALQRVSIAMHRFIWAFAESIGIPRLLNWIARHPLTYWVRNWLR